MGRTLHVSEVRLDGAEPAHSWKFPLGVTVIVGSIGGGKTSLLNLINFGLGGDPALTDEVTGAAQGVTLEVQAGERQLTLSRLFQGSGSIDVSEQGRPSETHSTQSGTERPWISDLLLEALGIPAIRVPRSRKGRSHELTRLSFRDVFAFLYLDQDQVDRSTMYSDDKFRNPKRLWMFELLHGIIDKQVSDLMVEIEEIRAETGERSELLLAVERFASEKQLPLQSGAIEDRLAAIDEEAPSLVSAVEAARERVEAAATDADEARERADNMEQELESLRHRHLSTVAELDGVQRAANQLARDIDTYERGTAARDVLAPFQFVRCPRCEQRLKPASDDQTCVVCGQPEPDETPDPAHDLEDLRGQLGETQVLAEHLESSRSYIDDEVQRLRSDLAEQRSRIRKIVADATAPHLGEVTKLEERLGALRAERQVLEESRRVATAVTEERSELAELEPKIEPLEERERQRRASLASAKERLTEVSEAFDEILRRFTLPWLESATVDQTDYLPRVNGRTLKQLSSGGMKATTNAAYYLSILTVAIRDPEVLTPRFLMLDSIRKDMGGDEKDLARGEKIYSFLQTLDAMRHTQSSLAADFQLIVVDNDLPRPYGSSFNTMRIDPEEPLIRSS